MSKKLNVNVEVLKTLVEGVIGAKKKDIISKDLKTLKSLEKQLMLATMEYKGEFSEKDIVKLNRIVGWIDSEVDKAEQVAMDSIIDIVNDSKEKEATPVKQVASSKVIKSQNKNKKDIKDTEKEAENEATVTSLEKEEKPVKKPVSKIHKIDIKELNIINNINPDTNYYIVLESVYKGTRINEVFKIIYKDDINVVILDDFTQLPEDLDKKTKDKIDYRGEGVIICDRSKFDVGIVQLFNGDHKEAYDIISAYSI